MPCVQWSLAYCNCHMIWQWIVGNGWYAGLVSLGPNDSTLWGLLGIGRIPGPGGIFPNQVQLVLLRWRSLGPSFAVPLLHWKPPSAPLLLWASSFVFQFQSICIKTALDCKSSPGRNHETVLQLLRSVSLKPVMKTGYFSSQTLSRLWNLMSKSSSSSASTKPVWKSTAFCEP